MAEPLVLEGKNLAKSIEESLKPRVAAFTEKSGGKVPVLATILVGDDPASATYVRMKGNACRRIGMESRKIELPSTTTTEELLAEIEALNQDRGVNGILLQHPVPDQIDERACFDAISLEKDVDGVTSLGFGRMAMGEFAYGSATPTGIMTILDHYNIPLKGKRAVVVGRSPILGKPLAMMLLNRHATVTICHSRTIDLPDVVREADIVVGAVGKPKFIQAGWIKQGAVIIDAGYHPGGIGDVDLEKAALRSSAYTPVPGGVGPMTIVSLISQTLEAAEKQNV
jgi:methylenetetrahydrofolate dehydrogenase (NADP+)/methenyltetrahydrofolate cyclohydrolase